VFLRFGVHLVGCEVTAFTACQHVVKEAAENGFAADFGFVSGDGRSFRCCTVGELSRDCDLVSVRAVQEKCDEKGRGVRSEKPMRDTGRGIPPLRLRSGQALFAKYAKRLGTRRGFSVWRGSVRLRTDRRRNGC
jgi:hypothetical protein